MQPNFGYYEDFEDAEELAWGRSQAFQKLLDNHRREERHRKRNQEFEKGSHHRQDWDWDDDDDDYDYEPYVDDVFDQYYEDRKSID